MKDGGQYLTVLDFEGRGRYHSTSVAALISKGVQLDALQCSIGLLRED